MGIQTEIRTGTGTKLEPNRKSNRSGQEPSRKFTPKRKNKPRPELKNREIKKKEESKVRWDGIKNTIMLKKEKSQNPEPE